MSYRNAQHDRLLPCNLRPSPEQHSVGLDVSPPRLTDGVREYSWLGRAPSGENQMSDGPCGIHALASLIEAAQRTRIVQAERDHAYKRAMRRFGKVAGDGLTFSEVCDVGVDIGWLPPGAFPIPASAADIATAPLLIAAKVNACIDQTNAHGVCNHSAAARASKVRGFHALTALAYGWIGNSTSPVWVLENSWGTAWGDHGLMTMTDELFADVTFEVWRVKYLQVVP